MQVLRYPVKPTSSGNTKSRLLRFRLCLHVGCCLALPIGSWFGRAFTFTFGSFDETIPADVLVVIELILGFVWGLIVHLATAQLGKYVRIHKTHLICFLQVRRGSGSSNLLGYLAQILGLVEGDGVILRVVPAKALEHTDTGMHKVRTVLSEQTWLLPRSS